MKDFFVSKDSLLYAHEMGASSDFSVRGFSAGLSEAVATLTITVSAEAGGSLWTPAEIATALWLDVADESTLTLSGTSVTAWQCKSNPARSFSVSAGAPPYNSANKFVELGGSHAIRTAVPCLYALNGVGVFVLSNITGTPVEDSIFIAEARDDSYIPMYRVCDGQSTDGSNASIYIRNDANTIVTGNTGLGGTDVLDPGFSIRYYEDSGSVFRATKNGAAPGAGFSYSRIGTVTLTRLGIGELPRLSQVMGRVENVHEIVALPTPSESDRQKIEGYLAHKWDSLLGETTLVSALPSDHPYKLAPPAI